MSSETKPALLFVEQHAFLGGGQRIIASMATHPMITRQWDVQFALPEDGPLSELLARANIPVFQFPNTPIRDGKKALRDLLLYAQSFLSLVAWFRRAIRATDVKYLYTSSPRYLLQMLCAVQRQPTRIVFHLHHFYRRRSYEWFFKFILSNPQVVAVICPSYAAEQWVRSILGPLPKIVHVPNWVCTEIPILKAFPASSVPVRLEAESPNSFSFAVIGRIVSIKGQDLFLEAAKRFIDLGANAEFYIIGSSAFTDQPDYKTNLIERYKSEPRIHFVGHVETMSEIYPQISCVVVPSRNEVFGMTAVEAMYYGVPVIVSDFGELPRIVEFGRSGAVFENGSVDALFDAMRKIFYDHQYRQTLIEEAGIHVRANYLPESGIARIQALLQ
jgi:glycosyltransferase involved in cell wall biosynthesis